MTLYSTLLLDYLRTGQATAHYATDRNYRAQGDFERIQLKRAVDTSSRSYTRSASHTVEKACCRPSWFSD